MSVILYNIRRFFGYHIQALARLFAGRALASEKDSSMNALFELLVELLLSTEELYRLFAAQLPDDAVFWEERAATMHRLAAWMRSLQFEIQEGAIGFNARRFAAEDAQRALTDARLLCEHVRQQPVTSTEAVEMALALERSSVKQYCYDVVVNHSGIASRVRQTMAEMLDTHRGHLAQHSGKSTSELC